FDVPVHRQRRERVELAEAALREGGEIQPQLGVLLALGQRLAASRRGYGHYGPSPPPRALHINSLLHKNSEACTRILILQSCPLPVDESRSSDCRGVDSIL